MAVYSFTSNTPVGYLAMVRTISQDRNYKHFLWTKKNKNKNTVKLNTEHWWTKGLSKNVPDNHFVFFNKRSLKKKKKKDFISKVESLL